MILVTVILVANAYASSYKSHEKRLHNLTTGTYQFTFGES
ncbi:hypothetical protein VCHA37P193_20271 [Vibrio chagasii]|nr:hypothetical protein VCHA37P193_20271 [Vibrio chagasii]